MTTDKTPLLFFSNAGWAGTGYGQQTGLFTPRLNKFYDVGISAFYGLEGARLQWNGMTVYPGQAPDLGNRTLLPHARSHFGGDLRAGLVVTLFDVWAMRPEIARAVNMACWVPVDHDPAPPRVLDFFRQSGATPIAMSRFGEEKLREADLDPLYVPHAVDTSVYRPIDKADARAETRMPEDRFIVGIVNANKGNPSRKAFAESLLAFGRFRRQHPDASLYLHTEATGVFGGVNLSRLLDEAKVPRESVLLTDQERYQFDPVGPDVMAKIYSSLDVLLAPTCGEGFGLTVLEANACGVPAIVTDFSAQPEVCGAGWKVGYSSYYTTQESWQAHPDVGEIYESLRSAYRRSTSEVEAQAAQAVEHAAAYDVEAVMENYMLPALALFEQRIGDRAPVAIEAAS